MQYDPFFIGGANLPYMYGRSRTSEQLVQPFSQKKKSAKSSALPKNDISHFRGKSRKVSPAKYKKIFMEAKEKAYNIFNFLIIKSQNLPYPLSKEELLLSDTDLALIEGLSATVNDYYSVVSLATLYAYHDMGIYEVKFRESDACPLCKAFDGTILTIEKLIDLLARNECLTHPSCDCDLQPIIRREDYTGLLEDYLEIDTVRIDDVFMASVPVELEEDLVELLANSDPDFDHIEFLDLIDYFKDNDLSYKGQVFYQEKEKVYVHNSYLYNLGPVDFLKKMLERDSKKEIIDTENLSGDVLYFKGREVIEKGGNYWDTTTGKRVF